MSDHFAEATVQISPNLKGFKSNLEGQLVEIMKNVRVPPVRVQPKLAVGSLGKLRTEVNELITKVQGQIKPIRIQVRIDAPSRRQLAELVQAPIAVGAATGHIAPPVGAAAGGVTAENQARINGLLARGAVELGGVAVAEEKVTKVRTRSTAAAKVQETREQKLARTRAGAKGILKDLGSIDVRAATAANDLAGARKALTIATELADKADALRTEQMSAETIAAQKAAHAERDRRFEILESLKATKKSAAATSAATGPVVSRRAAAQGNAAFEARTLGAAAIAGRASADEIAKAIEKSQDLARERSLLTTRTDLLTRSEEAVKQALRSGNIALIDAASNERSLARVAVQASKDRVAAARAASRENSAAARRSEQLTRGGQASLLSLAGIRGATLAASRSFLVGAAAITVFANAVRQFADLERNLDVFRATTSATRDEMEAVREEATRLGADLTLPAVSAGDAAGAMVELAKAGLSVQDSISGARGVLQLASAAAIDTADAVRLTANVLNAFSLSGREAITVADTLANAANAAQGSIADIGTAFQQAASAGHQVGLNFQDTATFLTILAKNGLRGSDAGTSLRTALIRLVNPSKEAAAQFEKLGIVLRDSAGHIRPDVFIQIAQATAKLAPAQRDATIALIGGQDAFRAVTILGRQTIKSFLDMRAALRQEGTAAELAKARNEGLHGAIDGLQSVLETVGTNLASKTGPALANFVRSVASGITSLSQNQGVLDGLNQGLAATTNSFNVLGTALSSVGAVVLPLTNLFLGLSNAIGGSGLVVSIAAVTLGFKALQAVIGSQLVSKATTIITGLAESFSVARKEAIAAEASTTRLSRTLIGLRASAAGALAGIGGLPTVAIAAAGAFYFLWQRIYRADSIAKTFSKTSSGLSSALARVTSARESLRSTARDVNSGGLALQQARLNAAIAQQAVLNSKAAKGSLERRQLLLNLAVATQNVTFATQDYQKALKDMQTATDAESVATEAFRSQQEDAAATLDKSITSLIKRAEVEKTVFSQAVKEKRARELIVEALKEQAKADLASSDVATQTIGQRENLLLQMVQRSKLPLDQLRKNLDAAFSAASLSSALRVAAKSFGIGGKQATDAFVKSVLQSLGSGSNLAEAIKRALEKVTPTSEAGGREQANAFMRGYVFQFQQNQPALADAAKQSLTGAQKLALLEVTGGSLAAQLAQARQNQADAARKLARGRARGVTEDALDDLISAKGQADSDVERITGEIEGNARDQQQKIDDAARKRDEAGQKIVDSILEGRRATLLQRRITSAGLTAWLGDDLKSNQSWLAFLRAQKKIMLERLKAAGASAAVIRAAMKQISDLIFGVANDIKKINDDIAQGVKDRQAARFDTIMQKFDLRIRIAQAKGDLAAEIKIRRQKIAQLTVEIKKLAAQGKKNTVAWLELVAQRAEEEAALRDLNAKNKDLSAQFKQQFEFLQTLSGFSANLIGNLIPFQSAMNLVNLSGAGKGLGLTGGGVVTGSGGSKANIPGIPGFHDNEGRGPRLPGSSPGRNLSSAATAAQAAQERGVTRGQGQTTNHLLRMMLAELHKLTRSQAHPEASHQRNKGAASFDYGYQGPGF